MSPLLLGGRKGGILECSLFRPASAGQMVAQQTTRIRFTASCSVFLLMLAITASWILLDAQFSQVTFVLSQSIVELDGASRMIVG